MIVIPMAGLSSRFFKAGYTKPKYMLELNGETLFDACLKSFSAYFKNETFVIILRDVYETRDFVEQRTKKLGIDDVIIVSLDAETRGQAETVYLGVKDLPKEFPITIFNIDTIRPNFSFPNFKNDDNSYLEVFKGSGENWSFVKPIDDSSDRVAQTTEKNPISDLCCTGLYHFSSISLFFEAYHSFLSLPKEKWDAGELYVAPLFNFLIDKGETVRYDLIERNDVIFCGTPDEYEELLNKG